MSTDNGWGRTFLWGAFAWLLVADLLALQFWPSVPQSRAQWFVFTALGPPLYVLGEFGSSWLFSRRHGQAISRNSFSVARILIALPAVLAAFAFSWWLLRLLKQ